MKKILTILSGLTVASLSAATLVACNQTSNTNVNTKYVDISSIKNNGSNVWSSYKGIIPFQYILNILNNPEDSTGKDYISFIASLSFTQNQEQAFEDIKKSKIEVYINDKGNNFVSSKLEQKDLEKIGELESAKKYLLDNKKEISIKFSTLTKEGKTIESNFIKVSDKWENNLNTSLELAKISNSLILNSKVEDKIKNNIEFANEKLLRRFAVIVAEEIKFQQIWTNNDDWNENPKNKIEGSDFGLHKEIIQAIRDEKNPEVWTSFQTGWKSKPFSFSLKNKTIEVKLELGTISVKPEQKEEGK